MIPSAAPHRCADAIRRAVAGVGAAALGLIALSASPAGAYCLIDPVGQANPLVAMVEHNPKAMIREAARRLARPQSPEEAGWLWATMAIGHQMLDQSVLAADDVARGLRLVRSGADSSAWLQLKTIEAAGSEDEATTVAAIARLQRYRHGLDPRSPATICLLDAIGTLQHVIDRPQDATRSITAAYRLAAGPGRETQRAWMTMMMGTVLMRAGDRDNALALNSEGVALAKAHHMAITLSNLLYIRGIYLIERKEYRQALAALNEASTIADRLQGAETAAYVAMEACHAQLELGHVDAAAPLCNRAVGPLSKTNSFKKVMLLRARIALARGQPRRALARLTHVLDGGTEVSVSTTRNTAYEVRARARAALGDMAGAYADLSEYSARMGRSYAAVLEKQTAELRARTLVGRAEAQNVALRAELRHAAETQRIRQREMLAATLAALAIIALLVRNILLGRTHARKLARLADTDTLTGLPNRRALSLLLETMDRDRSASVALIDLDRFKALNDRHGHAVGDAALQGFAEAARSVLRPDDRIARWGGEEFLLLMPDTTAGQAVTVVQRIRIACAAIVLPAAPDYRLTFSAGVVDVPAAPTPLDGPVMAADAALYRAKAMGRNCTMIGDTGPRAVDDAAEVGATQARAA